MLRKLMGKNWEMIVKINYQEEALLNYKAASITRTKRLQIIIILMKMGKLIKNKR